MSLSLRYTLFLSALAVSACLPFGIGDTKAQAQAGNDSIHASARQAAQTWRQAHEHAILDELIAFTSLPNTADRPDGLRRNAEFLVEAMRRRELTAGLLEADGAAPLAWGEWRVPGATRTYVFYAHYDGQPVNPDEWRSPPFSPTLRHPDGDGTALSPSTTQPLDPNWRLYARSASDDKGPIIAMLAALDALRAADIAPRANLRFVFEGEEEIGSPNLARLLHAHCDRTGGDLWLIGDGPEHGSGRRTVVFGIRGVETLDITLYGANRDLHSGHYGNWAPNPAMELARLLASMKDAEGRVTIDGFYDEVRPLNDDERAALRAIPNDDAAQMQALSLARTEGGGKRRLETAELPSLNVRGLASGRVGADAANVVPSTATAAIDIRLVGDMHHARTADTVIRHIERQGYHVVSDAPSAEVLRAHIHGPSRRATRTRRARRRPRTADPLPADGRQPAAVACRTDPWRAHHHRLHRQPRQPPARRRRKPAPGAPVARGRNDGHGDGDGVRSAAHTLE